MMMTRWVTGGTAALAIALTGGAVGGMAGFSGSGQVAGPQVQQVAAVAAVPAAAPGTCKQGYVWRDARPGDGVCVTPEERTRAKGQNANNNVNPDGGAFGKNTCQNSYVWREAWVGDVVCVTPTERDDTWRQNREGPSHANA